MCSCKLKCCQSDKYWIRVAGGRGECPVLLLHCPSAWPPRFIAVGSGMIGVPPSLPRCSTHASSRKNACASFPKIPSVSTHWYKVVCDSQLSIFRLLLFSLVCHCTCLSDGQLQVGWRKGVRAGGVPDKDSSAPPWHYSCPSGLFPSDQHIPAGSKCA